VTSRPLPIALVLLWLVGDALRLPILAVPPVIPALRSEFGLSGTKIGILTSLPVILFAAAAMAGSRLVARLGAVAAAVAGLLLAALGSALRGAAADVMTLFAATIVMGAGVAVTQPAMPALVGRWLPQHIGLGTGIYTNGLLVGEVLPVALFPPALSLTRRKLAGDVRFLGGADCRNRAPCHGDSAARGKRTRQHAGALVAHLARP
jgi:CP family cyanate transporter-like MFS transporter